MQKVRGILIGRMQPVHNGHMQIIRQILEEEGEEAARKKLTRAQRYAEGYATNATIDAFITSVTSYRMLFEQGSQEYEALLQLEKDVKLSSGIIKDEWILPAYQELYEIKHGRNVVDAVDAARKALRLW